MQGLLVLLAIEKVFSIYQSQNMHGPYLRYIALSYKISKREIVIRRNTQRRHIPPARHLAKVGVEVEDGVHDYWSGHVLVDGGTFVGVKVQCAEYQLPQLLTVVLCYRPNGPTHDLQYKCRQALSTKGNSV